MEERRDEPRPDDVIARDPTVEADEADPAVPGPGDSDAARPEPSPDPEGEEPTRPEPAGGTPDDAVDSSPDAAADTER